MVISMNDRGGWDGVRFYRNTEVREVKENRRRRAPSAALLRLVVPVATAPHLRAGAFVQQQSPSGRSG